MSIKGIYYEAEVFGVRLLWLAPHTLRQERVADVDYAVMHTFLEFYEVLQQFVNFKLFNVARLRYPPLQGGEALAMAEPGLDKLLHTAAPGAGGSAGGPKHAANLRRSNSPQEKPNQEAMARLRDKIRAIEAEEASRRAAATEAGGDQAVPAAPAADDDTVDEDKDEGGDDDQAPALFSGLCLYLGRETPRAALEFVAASFGARVVWVRLLRAPAGGGGGNRPVRATHLAPRASWTGGGRRSARCRSRRGHHAPRPGQTVRPRPRSAGPRVRAAPVGL